MARLMGNGEIFRKPTLVKKMLLSKLVFASLLKREQMLLFNLTPFLKRGIGVQQSIKDTKVVSRDTNGGCIFILTCSHYAKKVFVENSNSECLEQSVPSQV